jgi:hypothetical protein
VLPIHGDEHLRAANKDALEKAGAKVVAADNGDVLRVTKDGVTSINPATKGKPKFIGFKTLQGQNWYDKNYMQINAPQEKTGTEQPAPANTNTKIKRQSKIIRNPAASVSDGDRNRAVISTALPRLCGPSWW